MSLGQVHYVRVVADGSAVWSGIIRPVNFESRFLSESRVNGERNKMSFRRMVLSQLTIRVGTGSVEITQGCPAQAVRFSIPGEDAFYHPLGLTIRINRGLDVLLANGNACGNAVGRAAGRKNNVLHTGVRHGIQQPQRVGHIVANILARSSAGT